RIYVHRDVAEPFLAALVAEADAWTAQSGQPLVDRRLRQAVAAQVDGAVAAGAELLTGGAVPEGPGSHYPATVLASVPEGVDVLTEETFGPVAPVVVVDDFEE